MQRCRLRRAAGAARLGVRARARDSLLFVVAKGHQFPDFEQVVEQADGYDVVRKHENEAAEVAEETDPRS